MYCLRLRRLVLIFVNPLYQFRQSVGKAADAAVSGACLLFDFGDCDGLDG
ncbi:hypothetical protein M5099_00350 [Neisseria meningitidis]|uniref:Uncharacterized protein n=1 Tax=Neisseria meningitidis alpha153 TaxID=663926 RepID=C6SAG3_NEIME|nr:hypothetical protein F528_0898 [Neisseria meningitidis 992008]MCL5897366.1 hypothetical protein [Neisseria meningitidis]CBA03854.1 conserved hypothetical protein [Neisseria meningitidis alpha153]